MHRQAIENYNYWGDNRVLKALAGDGFLSRYGKVDPRTMQVAVDCTHIVEDGDDDLIARLFPGGEWVDEYEEQPERTVGIQWQHLTMERLRSYLHIGVSEEALWDAWAKPTYNKWVTIPEHRRHFRRYKPPEMEHYVILLPARYIICPTCSGSGKVVNPSIDCGGYRFDEDDYDYETGESRYMRGDYDVQCPECKGRTTVLSTNITANNLSPQQRALIEYAQEYDKDAWAHAREVAAERRMGC